MDSSLIYVAVVAAVVAAGLAYRRWHVRIHGWLRRAANWFWDSLLDGKTCRVVEQFLLESAVLWFVFPLLDSLYDTSKKVPPGLVHQSYVLAAIFLLFAVLLSHAGKDD